MKNLQFTSPPLTLDEVIKRVKNATPVRSNRRDASWLNGHFRRDDRTKHNPRRPEFRIKM